MQPQFCALQNCVMFLPQYFDSAKATQINRSTGAIVTGTGDPYNGLTLGGTEFPQQAKDRIAQASDPAVLAVFHGIPKDLANRYSATFGPAPRFRL